MDARGRRCESGPMHARPPLDEVYGARALGALLIGDLAGAVDAPGLVSTEYLVGFFCRLALVAPSVSVRLAYRVWHRRLGGSSS